jgi:hypothetical protein
MGLSLAAHLLSEPIRSGYSKLLFYVTIDRQSSSLKLRKNCFVVRGYNRFDIYSKIQRFCGFKNAPFVYSLLFTCTTVVLSII